MDHVTIHRWVQRFTPLLIDAARPCLVRWCPETAVLFECAGRKPEVHCSIRRPQKSCSNGGGYGIHGKAPAKVGSSSGLSLGFASFGGGLAWAGSDRMQVTQFVTPNVSVSGVREYRDIRRRRGYALGRSAEEPAAAHSRLSRSLRQEDGGWGRSGRRRGHEKTHPPRAHRE